MHSYFLDFFGLNGLEVLTGWHSWPNDEFAMNVAWNCRRMRRTDYVRAAWWQWAWGSGWEKSLTFGRPGCRRQCRRLELRHL